jgi:hypothetical protein
MRPDALHVRQRTLTLNAKRVTAWQDEVGSRCFLSQPRGGSKRMLRYNYQTCLNPNLHLQISHGLDCFALSEDLPIVQIDSKKKAMNAMSFPISQAKLAVV